MAALTTHSLLRTGSLFAVALLCGACATNKPPVVEAPPTQESRETASPAKSAASQNIETAPLSKAQQDLAAGVARYEDGNYKLAARLLQDALNQGLELTAEQARAHKYLAFIHCVGSRQNLCRDEFRKALEADPAFDLSPAEAGHPIWGPIFRKLKAGDKPAPKPAAKPAKKPAKKPVDQN